ncbi:hypothetical protein [Chitinophaga sp. HK235]|uniref:hypothetical protein n=1 Tax=Chitinophaga sp. HK235 TaxID=2952571 RepID=UPI001BAC639C|nr:hypothetical protein [Chitinophaga sp. HK235]
MMERKQEIDELRTYFPVGIRHAQMLLSKTNGDVAAAAALFKAEIKAVVLGKTDASPELVQQQLEQHQYDIAKTLAGIEEARFTLTERILRKYKNDHETALDKICLAIEEAAQLKRNYWLPLDELKQQLHPCPYCLMVVSEWLSFEGWEGFDVACSFYPAVVTEEITATLQLPLVAAAILKADEAAFQQHRAQLIQKLYTMVVQQVTQFP